MKLLECQRKCHLNCEDSFPPQFKADIYTSVHAVHIYTPRAASHSQVQHQSCSLSERLALRAFSSRIMTCAVGRPLQGDLTSSASRISAVVYFYFFHFDCPGSSLWRVGFSRCRARTPECVGSVLVAHGLSYPTARGILVP